jgi:hypothetical protein
MYKLVNDINWAAHQTKVIGFTGKDGRGCYVSRLLIKENCHCSRDCWKRKITLLLVPWNKLFFRFTRNFGVFSGDWFDGYSCPPDRWALFKNELKLLYLREREKKEGMKIYLHPPLSITSYLAWTFFFIFESECFFGYWKSWMMIFSKVPFFKMNAK